MKKIVIALLLTSGFVVAKERKPASGEALTADQQHGMSTSRKEALRTQSPAIKLAKVRHNETLREGDRIVINKTTITAVVPQDR